MDLAQKTLDSLWQIVVVGLVLGAGLPTMFALGVRLMFARDTGATTETGRSIARTVAGTLCFVVVVVAVVGGILFVMKDFLANDVGIHLF